MGKVRFYDAGSLFEEAEIVKGIAYDRIFRFAMKEGRECQLIIKHKFIDWNGYTMK